MQAATTQPTDEARVLHDEAPPIDLHADSLLWARLVGYDLNRRHDPPLPRAWLGGHVDVPRLHDARMGAQFFGLVSLPYLDADLEAICHRQIDLLEAAVARSENKLRLVRTAEQIATARRDGAVAGLLGIEGAHALRGNIDALTKFAARGVRYLGLVHFTRNECASPAVGKGASKDRALTSFGRDVIARCEELSVLVDLAHINRTGFMEACAIARKPLLVSHTGVSGVHRHWRNIDDEQLRAVANGGGVAGVIFCPYYLGGDGVSAVVEHIAHVVDVAGEETAALGSDWDGFIRPTRGLEEPSKLFALTEALLQRGLAASTVRKILHDNVMRILRA